MKQNTSQSSEIGYLKWGLIIALFSAVGTYLGLGVAYLSWQHPKAPKVEAQKLASQQEAMSTPTSTPVPTPASVVPSPSVTPSPSPTPKVAAQRRKPRRGGGVRDDGLCIATDEQGFDLVDDNGNPILVPCNPPEGEDSEASEEEPPQG